MSTLYTGDKTAAESPATAPEGLPEIPILIPENGVDFIDAASVAQAFKALANYVDALRSVAISTNFGDGVDGSATAFDGQPSSCMFTTLELTSGTHLTRGVPIWCRDEFLWGSATLSGAGANGSAGSGGGGGAGGSGSNGPHGGIEGASGSANGGAVSDVSIYGICPAAFGAGGGGGAGANGVGGTGGVVTTDLRSWRVAPYRFGTRITPTNDFYTARRPLSYYSGAGGGGGGRGGGGGGGGGGGQGGGLIVVVARRVVISGTPVWTAAGGNGGNGQSATNAGGGGGGGGGGLLVICSELVGSLPNGTVVGGTGGTASGSGVNGTNGSAGVTAPLIVQVSL